MKFMSKAKSVKLTLKDWQAIIGLLREDADSDERSDYGNTLRRRTADELAGQIEKGLENGRSKESLDGTCRRSEGNNRQLL